MNVSLVLQDLIEKIPERLSSDCLENCVDIFVKQEIGQYESEDIENQKKLFVKWTAEREEMFEQQLQDYKKKEKEDEVKQRLIELREKEEILSMFERKHKLDIAVNKADMWKVGRKHVDAKQQDKMLKL